MAKWMGIDIGPTAIRVALVKSSYRKPVLEAFREELIADHETPSAAMRAATAGLKADAYAAALPGERGFVRFLSLPKAAQKALGEVLGFEVESTLPFEMDDAVMDHRVLPPTSMTPDEQLPILAVVAYTEEVRERIGLVLRGAGSEPQRVGLGPLPLANLGQLCPSLAQSTTPIAILELAEDHADFIVLQNGHPRFVRSISRGIAGLPADAGAIARELRMTLAAWRVEGGEPVSKIHVTGVGRHTTGLDAFVQSNLDLEVADLPPMEMDGITPDLQVQLPRFAKALGLAMGLSRRPADLDLRQGPLAAQQSYQFLRDKTPLLAGLAAAIFVSFGFSIYAEMKALDAERASLDQQLEAATITHFGKPETDPVVAAQMLDDAIAGRTDEPMPKVDAFDVMVELSKRIPSEMTHDIAEFDVNRDKVDLKGIVPTIDDANKVAAALGEHECFRNVNITRTTRLKQQDKQKYTLELTIRCAGGDDAKGKGKKGKKPTKGGK